MFDIYLVIALGTTFAAVMLLGLAATASSARRKPIELLHAQVGEISTSLREQELSTSLTERLFLPAFKQVGSVARRITPAETGRSIEARLGRAGLSASWDVEKIGASKLLAAFAGLLLGIALGNSLGAQRPAVLLCAIAFIGMGFFVPDAVLAHIGEARQKQIRNSLPDTMDLLTISVEAGLGFDAALMRVTDNRSDPLAQEFNRMLQEMRLGVSRMDAFRHLGTRTNVQELDSFIVAMIQADQFGVSIAKVLRAQAQELRTKRSQRAEELAMRVPVKILFPLIFCVFPSLLIVILGPGAIRIAQDLFGMGP